MALESRCFTFVWKLQNAGYNIQKKGEFLESPAFVVNAIEETKWKLRFYPRGCSGQINDIGYYLHREKDSSGGDNVEIKYELTIIGIDGSDLTKRGVYKAVFSKGAAFGGLNMSVKDVFVTRRSIFLPNDTLSIRCRIWKSEGEMAEDVKCSAVTRIGCEMRSVKWDVKNFSTLELGKKLNYLIKSKQNDLPLMSVDLSLVQGSTSEEIIRFDLSLRDQSIKHVSLRLLILLISGKKIKSTDEIIWFDSSAPSKRITFPLTKKSLLHSKDIYLRNDTLSLIWEWNFSRGIVSEEAEEDEHGCICSELKVSDVQNKFENNIFSYRSFLLNLKSLYDEQFLSDVKLKTKTSEFPAHKFMLSASSSVFKAMFSQDMKENIVHIKNLDDETVRQMIYFSYTGIIGALSLDKTIKLHAAAYEYDILNLKNVCSSYIKTNLSPTNASDALLLADKYSDAEMKSVVQDYIMENGKQISKSYQWKKLMETNGKLAAETVCKLFK